MLTCTQLRNIAIRYFIAVDQIRHKTATRIPPLAISECIWMCQAGPCDTLHRLVYIRVTCAGVLLLKCALHSIYRISPPQTGYRIIETTNILPNLVRFVYCGLWQAEHMVVYEISGRR